MGKPFQVVVMTVSLLIVVQSIFAETEKLNNATISTEEQQKDIYNHRAGKNDAVPSPVPAPAAAPAAPSPAKSVEDENVKMQGDGVRQKDEAGHYIVCQTKPWLCN